MAIITTSKPGITDEQAMEVFQRHFAGKYAIDKTRVINRDFIVKKSALAGISVGVKPDKDGGTEFVYSPIVPHMLIRATVGGLLGALLVHSQTKAMEEEVASFIKSAPEFNTGPSAPAQPAESA